MRKLLLATTATAAVCAFAAQAQAQVTVTLGGYTEFFAATFDDDTGSDRTSREFQLETEIVVKADGKADNGLLYGTKIELQNSTPNGGTGVGTDEASVYLGGTWGRLELGDFDGASDTLKIYAPVIGVEQIDGDYPDFAGGQPNFGMHIPNSGDSTKIMYLTPRIAGFQGGASYTPEADNQAQSVVALKTVSTYKDVGEFGINYTGEFSGLGVALGATLTTASSGTTSGVEDFTAWNLGAQFTFGGFAFGGGYVDAGDFLLPTTGAIDDDQTAWHVGGSYTVGPVAVAASYLNAQGYTGAYGGTTDYSDDYQAFSVGATYALAPGMILETEVTFFEDDVLTGTRGATVKGSNDGYVFVVGTRLDF
ncbi:porin [Skermanella rosea]|uniref:porin n=1 Tax=Skermanella rosea TaxID=1817965 RepID=UPI0019319DD1|nr:porin [Skermanella rosea]UEM03813.1 porin [Skermanella rosea]